MKITGNTIKSKIRSINGTEVKSVANNGGNTFTVYLNDEADNFKVAYALMRAGYKRTANNGMSISIEA